MTDTTEHQRATNLRAALAVTDASRRLQAALTAGTHPDPAWIDVLVDRCAVEPDFFVRDMLTWALVRQDRAQTLDALVPQLQSDVAQARSQALHTLSKIADPATWPAITPALLADPDDEVAAAAWRAAAGLVPAGSEAALAASLTAQFGRGDAETQRRLSRALAALGDPARASVERAARSSDEAISAHALATVALIDDPDESFESAVHEAKRAVALRAAPSAE
ncbi:HEAT repeat domain-containing protein [Microbacterium invictum]|uniref:HEAT repeat domain-containing protein n=1 Tax=Microbacterium invictum TaxID=515415 RepID=A0ABZ0V9P2_9MICO|nr:HEAT repeat domain-containing protein [Microbacterium invictum]WQB70332.1 HEAT repeat domain-containing protein [Microbacterium invictum]